MLAVFLLKRFSSIAIILTKYSQEMYLFLELWGCYYLYPSPHEYQKLRQGDQTPPDPLDTGYGAFDEPPPPANPAILQPLEETKPRKDPKRSGKEAHKGRGAYKST